MTGNRGLSRIAWLRWLTRAWRSGTHGTPGPCNPYRSKYRVRCVKRDGSRGVRERRRRQIPVGLLCGGCIVLAAAAQWMMGLCAVRASGLHRHSRVNQEANMDPTRFDRLAIVVGQRTTRRAALGLLAAIGLTGLVHEEAAAACLANGVRCGAGRGRCCSGWCKRKAGTSRKFCKAAPNQGICTIESNRCNFSGIVCSKSDNTCSCYVTPAGRSFCGSNGCFSQDCSSDADCEPNHGVGAICIPAGTACCGGTKGCIAACSDPA